MKAEKGPENETERKLRERSVRRMVSLKLRVETNSITRGVQGANAIWRQSKRKIENELPINQQEGH